MFADTFRTFYRYSGTFKTKNLFLDNLQNNVTKFRPESIVEKDWQGSNEDLFGNERTHNFERASDLTRHRDRTRDCGKSQTFKHGTSN